MAAEPAAAAPLAAPPRHVTLSELIVEASAGTVGGVVGVLTGSPFDVVKTRQQVRAGLTARAAIAELLASEGPRAFFKGSLASALGQAPNNFIVFYAWASARAWLREHGIAERLGAATPAAAEDARVFLAGSYAGVTQSVALAPFERVKVQQQLFRGGTLPMGECARELVRAQGVGRGLFTGLAATVLRDAPTFGIYFLSFERGKYAIAGAVGGAPRRAGDGRPLPAFALLSAGALSGVLSWALALPADVVKSHIQGAPAGTPAAELRVARVARSLYRAHGPSVFFRGGAACLLRAAPVNGVCFWGYEATHEWFKGALRARGEGGGAP